MCPGADVQPLGTEVPGHQTCMSSYLPGNDTLFSKVIVPPSSVTTFLWWFCLFGEYKRYMWFHFSISLITNGFLVCLLAIWISFSVRCLFLFCLFFYFLFYFHFDNFLFSAFVFLIYMYTHIFVIWCKYHLPVYGFSLCFFQVVFW